MPMHRDRSGIDLLWPPQPLPLPYPNLTTVRNVVHFIFYFFSISSTTWIWSFVSSSKVIWSIFTSGWYKSEQQSVQVSHLYHPAIFIIYSCLIFSIFCVFFLSQACQQFVYCLFQRPMINLLFLVFSKYEKGILKIPKVKWDNVYVTCMKWTLNEGYLLLLLILNMWLYSYLIVPTLSIDVIF